MDIARTVLTVALLVAVTYALVRAVGVQHAWLQPWAILRAVVQLGVLSVLLSGIVSDPVWVAVFLGVMVVAATAVVASRLRIGPGRVPLIALILVTAAAVPLLLVFATQAIDFTPRYVLATGGIIIGNAMTVTTLAGRSLQSAIAGQRDEIEGWLALGATPRRATRRAVRSASSTALIPSTDQARTTGIVTLPGAFVGAIFGGASPLDAAQFQVLVLAAILAAGAIVVGAISIFFGAPRTLPLLPVD